jgi:hypothetical protein
LPGKLAQGTLCIILNEQEIKLHKVRYHLERTWNDRIAGYLAVSGSEYH